MTDVVGTPVVAPVPGTDAGYGNTERVAALAQMWTTAGEWIDPLPGIDGTNPTLTQVIAWLTEISAMMDLALSNAGFVVPVLVQAAINAIGPYVEALTADMCHAANASGRFYTERVIERGMSPMIIIQQNIHGWVTSNTQGLKNMGVPFIGDDAPVRAFSVQPDKQL
jgi:hypothetical protein